MKRVALFFVVLLFSAFLGWLCGYNFDTRSPWVAYWALMSVFLAGLAATAPIDALK